MFERFAVFQSSGYNFKMTKHLTLLKKRILFVLGFMIAMPFFTEKVVVQIDSKRTIHFEIKQEIRCDNII